MIKASLFTTDDQSECSCWVIESADAHGLGVREPDNWDNTQVNTQVRAAMDSPGRRKAKRSPQSFPCGLGAEGRKMLSTLASV